MIKILVIDDDRMNCELIQSVFTRHGYQVLSATSGIEGLTIFRQQAPRVTILDLRMPEMDGLTVLKEIRAYDPHAPVIILGGGATEEQENQARGCASPILSERACRLMCWSNASTGWCSFQLNPFPLCRWQAAQPWPIRGKRSSLSMTSRWFATYSSSFSASAAIGPSA